MAQTQQKKKDVKAQNRKQEIRKQRIRRQRMRRIVFGVELFCILGFWLFWGIGSSKKQETQETSLVSFHEQESVHPEVPKEEKTEGERQVPNVQASSVQKKELPQELLLVNKENKLPEDYDVTLMLLSDGVHKAAEEAYEPLCKMLKAGEKEGLHFVVCSAYRDVKYQEKLFKEDLDALMKSGYSYEKAYQEVAKSTMPPGYSEHSTGFAFDIVALDYQMLDAGQEKTEENKWLQQHCAEYGFILRYPKDKADITGISYESWHFRYVGEEAAQIIMDEEITLEEYLEEL